jgi:hypothetical protein
MPFQSFRLAEIALQESSNLDGQMIPISAQNHKP